jgi:hypothetical protein
MTRHSRFFLSLALAVSAMQEVRADIALEWNALALEVSRGRNESAPEASRTMAILHTSIYDAVNGIVGSHTPYGSTGVNLGGASIHAAASQAAYTALSQIYGSSAPFQSLYDTQMAGIASGQARTDGMNWGSNVATTILNMRVGDGASSANAPYTVSSVAPHWQPTPHSDPALHVTAQPQLTGWGNVTTFGVQDADAAHGNTLPALNSTTYANDYNEVMAYGAQGSSVRGDDGTHIAHFWSAGSSAGSNQSIAQWNEIAETLAVSAGLDLATEARMLAALNMTLADTLIATWKAKYEMDLWRPITAIAYGDEDGNAGTVGDPFAGFPGSWNPELDTASSPETGDVAAIGTAASDILRRYFGDDDAFTLASDINGDGIIDVNDATYDRNGDGFITVADAYREFSSLSEAEAEALLSGIYSGNNFRFSVLQSSDSGTAVANEVAQNYFLPVPEPSSVMLVGLACMMIRQRRRR